MSPNSGASKSAALEAVGRILVNFQQLEHNLKLAARLGPLEGTLQKMQRDAKSRADRAATMTMGQAIGAWVAAANSEPMESGYTDDLFDATMQLTFTVGDASSREKRASALRTLLEARNRLIHGGLIAVNWDSSEDCARLIDDLGDLDRAIREQVVYFGTMLRAIGAIRPEHLERALAHGGVSPELATRVDDDA